MCRGDDEDEVRAAGTIPQSTAYGIQPSFVIDNLETHQPLSLVYYPRRTFMERRDGYSWAQTKSWCRMLKRTSQLERSNAQVDPIQKLCCSYV